MAFTAPATAPVASTEREREEPRRQSLAIAPAK